MAIDLLFLPAVTILGCVTVLWAISLRLRDASIADIWWGPGFALIAWVLFLNTVPTSDRLLLVVALLTVWGLRLGLYLGHRNLGHAEDKRYQAMRRGSPGFWWISLFKVFYLQGALQLIVALPVYTIAVSSTSLNWLDVAASGVAAAGIVLEATADWQLSRFKRSPDTTHSVLQTGVWGWCRHPNYFGNALIWLGIGAIAMAGGAPWWILSGPAVMWFLLLKVSGVSMLERTIVDRRPEYREYIARVPAFFPNPFSRR
jgi:steroid 5-alpha reductase family enzyme